jgi:hypothetical protein
MNSLGSIDDFSYKGYITTFDVVIVRLEDCKIYIHDSLSRHFSLLSHFFGKEVSGNGVQLVSASTTDDGSTSPLAISEVFL